MANFLYNGVVLPELPEWDKETYPYAVIVKHNPIFGVGLNGYYLYLLGVNSYYFETEQGIFFGGDSDGVSVPGVNYKCSDGVWEYINHHDNWNVEVASSYVSNTNKSVWSNFNIEYDGTLYLAATDPINTDSKLSISMGQMMSYNGTVLPPLPDCDYQYATIIKPTLGMGLEWELHFSTQKSECSAFSETTLSGNRKVYRWKRDYNEWKFVWEYNDYTNSIKGNLVWANHDIVYSDSYVDNLGNSHAGEVYFSASEPLQSVAASFTCSNLNTTDSVYKIAAWCYPKGTSYLNAPHTYTSAYYFGGKNHSETWTLPMLTEGTEYELYACIMVDDAVTDHNAIAYFTADGTTEELDFTNAALAVSWGKVFYNHYNFELTCTGLPYMANGTTAIFDVVGVTDAGDRAVMGGKIASGSDMVTGTFTGLEPMTDYTATFEVYYNGQPTGVTASVSFTTEEEYTPTGGYDRDSFLLGFASGLGCTAATKDGAEYNSWAWGYIAGSALRKAL